MFRDRVTSAQIVAELVSLLRNKTDDDASTLTARKEAVGALQNLAWHSPPNALLMIRGGALRCAQRGRGRRCWHQPLRSHCWHQPLRSRVFKFAPRLRPGRPLAAMLGDTGLKMALREDIAGSMLNMLVCAKAARRASLPLRSALVVIPRPCGAGSSAIGGDSVGRCHSWAACCERKCATGGSHRPALVSVPCYGNWTDGRGREADGIVSTPCNAGGR